MAREHGTNARYRIDGCRCDRCRAAATAQQRDYLRRRSVAPVYVAANRAREHLAELAEAGVGLRTVARVSGVAHGSLTKMVYGDRPRGMGPSRRIRPETERAILSVTVADAAPGCRVDAAATWRHVDELLSRGWTRAAIGRAIGQTGGALQLGRTTVSAGHARRVRQLLDEPVPKRRSRWDGTDDMDGTRRASAAASPAARTAGDVELPHLRDVDEGDTGWMTRGACRLGGHPTWLFFPARGDMQTARAAREVCATCAVADECLDYALRLHLTHGVWGGRSERERRRMRRDRGLGRPDDLEDSA